MTNQCWDVAVVDVVVEEEAEGEEQERNWEMTSLHVFVHERLEMSYERGLQHTSHTVITVFTKPFAYPKSAMNSFSIPSAITSFGSNLAA